MQIIATVKCKDLTLSSKEFLHKDRLVSARTYGNNGNFCFQNVFQEADIISGVGRQILITIYAGNRIIPARTSL